MFECGTQYDRRCPRCRQTQTERVYIVEEDVFLRLVREVAGKEPGDAAADEDEAVYRAVVTMTDSYDLFLRQQEHDADDILMTIAESQPRCGAPVAPHDRAPDYEGFLAHAAIEAEQAAMDDLHAVCGVCVMCDACGVCVVCGVCWCV
jgi:hypothetical protein